MLIKAMRSSNSGVNKLVDFGKQLFSSILRSRKGTLSEFARLSRFQRGTKGFEREFKRLEVKRNVISDLYHRAVIDNLPTQGITLGIIDDSPLKKFGKTFPKQQKNYNHCTNSFYEGMKLFSASLYRQGKVATIFSELVSKEDNKLWKAQKVVDNFMSAVDVFLFDSWFCKTSLLDHIIRHEKYFISRIRRDAKLDVDERLDVLFKSVDHKEYKKIKIEGKSYWIYEFEAEFKTYGSLRVIASKQGQHDKPIFLVTNNKKFLAKFVVKLYKRRFAIEVFFKDAKQFLNLETFQCRSSQSWELHLLIVNILHWAIQKKKSISKTIRKIREDFGKCWLFINENQLIAKIFDGIKEKCLI